MRKLRKAEQDVVEKMRSGYILRSQDIFGYSVWLRKDLPNHYILSNDIRKATLKNLMLLGIVEKGKTDKHKHQHYKLTRLVKKINP